MTDPLIHILHTLNKLNLGYVVDNFEFMRNFNVVRIIENVSATSRRYFSRMMGEYFT